MLVIEHLYVDYGNRAVLRDVSLSARSGEVLALIGPNGAGKSTLIRAASGVIAIRSGNVRTNGTDFAVLSPMQRARHLAGEALTYDRKALDRFDKVIHELGLPK